MENKILLLLTIVTALLFASIIVPATASSAVTANNSLQENYQRVGVVYTAGSSSLGGSEIAYEITNGTYAGAAANNTVALNNANYAGIVSGAPVSVSISVTSSYSAASNFAQVTVSGSGGTLLFASIYQTGDMQMLWAGATQISSGSTTTVSGLASVNASQSASVILGFAGTSGVENVSASLGASASFSLDLPKITFSETSSSKIDSRVIVVIPERYSALSIGGSGTINSSSSISTPLVSVGMSSFANATYPDFVWQGRASSSVSVQGNSSPANVSARTVEFFGINGTIVGYTQVENLNSNHSTTLLGVNTNVQAYSTSTLIVYSNISPQAGSSSSGTGSGIILSIGGEPIVLQVSSSNQVKSSASVELQHEVKANSSTYLLLLLSTNSSAHSYFLINTSTNSATRVDSVTPTSQSNATVSYHSKMYQAMQVNVSARGNIVFNVSSLSFSSVIVFKTTSSGLVQLNSSNYWDSNGRVYVFDDPSTTYYIADNNLAATTSSLTPTSSVTQLGSTSNGVTTSHQSATGSNSSVTTSSSNSSGIPLEAAAVSVAVLILVIAAVAFLRRRKSP